MWSAVLPGSCGSLGRGRRCGAFLGKETLLRVVEGREEAPRAGVPGGDREPQLFASDPFPSLSVRCTELEAGGPTECVQSRTFKNTDYSSGTRGLTRKQDWQVLGAARTEG